ncbi:MAG: cob(I)yrinic acid a,c-diamide adenosyltransferase [Ignavibacteriaceae bacterium]
MKIYTKTGDKGETGLFGGKRIPKSSVRINAYGTVDELNAVIGVALCYVENEKVKSVLRKLQNQLFVVGADLATPLEVESKNISIPRVSEEDISESEKAIDFFDKQLEELRYFILPGGTKSAAQLHVARTICRRAEREVVLLSQQEEINQNIVIFVNRISDLLFVLSRVENKTAEIPDQKWEKPI